VTDQFGNPIDPQNPLGATPPPAPPTPPRGTPPPPPPPPPPSNTPPPPPPPATTWQDGTAASPTSSVDVGAAASWAFKKFGQYAPVWLMLAGVVFVLRLLQNLFANWMADRSTTNCSPSLAADGTFSSNCTTSFTAGIAAGLIGAIIFGILTALASIGIYRAALKTSKGEAPTFADLTSTENLGPYIIVAIVYGLLSAVGLVLCIIPGLLVIFFLQFSPYFALDKGMGVSEAFSSSASVVKRAPLAVILAMIVTAIALVMGTWIWGVLTLVALPFAALFVVNIYRQLNREPVTP